MIGIILAFWYASYSRKPQYIKTNIMQITFIQPGMSSAKSTDAMQPLVFAVLAVLTPPDIDCVFYDDRIEPIPLDEATDLVAMSVDTFSAKRAYGIAQKYRERHIPVIMGGHHATLCSQEVSNHATTVAIGDAEAVWPLIIEDWRKGELGQSYKSDAYSLCLETLYDRNIFSGKKYVPMNIVQWGRGCPYHCDFCSVNAFYRHRQCYRSIDSVINELEDLGSRPVFFVDDNLFHEKDRFTNFLNSLSSLKIRWVCQISIDVAGNKDLMTLLEKSGCIAAIIGFESLDKKNLIQMKKAWNDTTHYDTAVEIFRDHGIMIYGTFVFGYDNDHPDSFDICLDFALRSRLLLANFNPLTPTPGTALYKRLLKEERLIYPTWWNDPAYRYGEAIFHPGMMSAQELTEGCFQARKTFNKYSSIASRMLDRHANMKSFQNLWLYLSANLTNRKEIYQKQGRQLGV